MLSCYAHVGHCVTLVSWYEPLYWEKVPQLILWKPFCLCPCAKQLQLLQLARILAKYWWLPVETQPVKTIWEETSFSGDDSRAKQNHRQCGGIRTQPNLPTSRPRERIEHQKEEGKRHTGSKMRRGRGIKGEDMEDVDTESCTVWLCSSSALHCSSPVQLTRDFIPMVHLTTALTALLLVPTMSSHTDYLQGCGVVTCSF